MFVSMYLSFSLLLLLTSCSFPYSLTLCLHLSQRPSRVVSCVHISFPIDTRVPTNTHEAHLYIHPSKYSQTHTSCISRANHREKHASIVLFPRYNHVPSRVWICMRVRVCLCVCDLVFHYAYVTITLSLIRYSIIFVFRVVLLFCFPFDLRRVGLAWYDTYKDDIHSDNIRMCVGFVFGRSIGPFEGSPSSSVFLSLLLWCDGNNAELHHVRIGILLQSMRSVLRAYDY